MTALDKSGLVALAERVEALTGERARPFGDYYAVTENGHVFSGTKGGVYELNRTPNSRGYLCTQMTVDGVSRKVRVHQAVATAFHGQRPDGAVARHLDDDKLNNCASNIAWGTLSENARDAVRNGRCRAGETSKKTGVQRRGENNRASKLTEDGVRDIRQRSAKGESYAALAKAYSVDKSAIHLLCKGKTWQHIL